MALPQKIIKAIETDVNDIGVPRASERSGDFSWTVKKNIEEIGEELVKVGYLRFIKNSFGYMNTAEYDKWLRPQIEAAVKRAAEYQQHVKAGIHAAIEDHRRSRTKRIFTEAIGRAPSDAELNSWLSRSDLISEEAMDAAIRATKAAVEANDRAQRAALEAMEQERQRQAAAQAQAEREAKAREAQAKQNQSELMEEIAKRKAAQDAADKAAAAKAAMELAKSKDRNSPPTPQTTTQDEIDKWTKTGGGMGNETPPPPAKGGSSAMIFGLVTLAAVAVVAFRGQR